MPRTIDNIWHMFLTLKLHMRALSCIFYISPLRKCCSTRASPDISHTSSWLGSENAIGKFHSLAQLLKSQNAELLLLRFRISEIELLFDLKRIANGVIQVFWKPALFLQREKNYANSFLDNFSSSVGFKWNCMNKIFRMNSNRNLIVWSFSMDWIYNIKRTRKESQKNL